MSESFRRFHRLTEDEVEKLTDKLAESLKNEVYMYAKLKAEMAVDRLLSERHDIGDTITVLWEVKTNIGAFDNWLGEIRRKANEKQKRSLRPQK